MKENISGGFDIMPNWCQNKVIMYGGKKDIDKIYIILDNQIKNNKDISLLNELIPIPEEYNNTDEWYEWCMDNYGTKWYENIEKDNIKRRDNKILELKFETANSPPIIGYTKISEIFPKITIIISHYESGIGIAGYSKIKNGEEVECVEYDNMKAFQSVAELIYGINIK